MMGTAVRVKHSQFHSKNLPIILLNIVHLLCERIRGIVTYSGHLSAGQFSSSMAMIPAGR